MSNATSLIRSPVQMIRAVPPRVWWMAAFAAAAAIPLVSSNLYLFRILTMIVIWSILALGQNLITGFCGQLSYGQAAFYGIGAYTSALATIHFGLPFPVTLLLAVAMAGIFGARIGGDYLFLVTIGFAEIAGWSS